MHAVPGMPSAALYGGTNILEHHAGSPLLLLALLQVYSPALWIFIYALYGCLLLSWNLLALPLVTLPGVS